MSASALIAAGCSALIAVSLALLLPTTVVPDSVFYNQLVAVAGWGMWLLTGPGSPARGRPPPNVPDAADFQLRGSACHALTPALAALGLCAMACAVGIGLQGGALLVILAAMAVLAAAAHPAAGTRCAVLPVAVAFWLAGMGSAVVALVQYAAPDLADGAWVATSSVPGRAVGNLRQPNHLATALLCAMVMSAWLWQAMDAAGAARRWWAAAGVVSIAAMVLALAMSASRTGALSLGVLVAWAALDRRLPRAARWTLALTPVFYALCWGALAAHASLDHGAFYGTERLHSGSDISSSRFAIWKNALALLAAHPWTGVGWGHFNEAWTLTPFADRPVAFFDHTHNLPLQLAVEMGIPGALAVLGLLGGALWRARGAWHAGAAPAPDRVQGAQPAGKAPSWLPVDTVASAAPAPADAARAAAAMLAVLALHSLLEYPLWYAYFLLPAAWALGVFIGAAPRTGCATTAEKRMAVNVAINRPEGRTTAPPGREAEAPLLQRARLGALAAAAPRLAGALMLAGALWAAAQHRTVERIFEVAEGAPPLAERIARGRASTLFGHHADYAAVTTPPRDTAPESFRRPLRQLIDTRLLIAWAEALKAQGHHEEALYAAQRLREFRRPDAQDYFKDCGSAKTPPPWQCETRPAGGRWLELAP